MTKTKEEILNELKEKTKNMTPWLRVIYAFGIFFKGLYDVITTLINLILTLISGLIKIAIKILLFGVMLFFIFNFTGFLTKEGLDLSNQFSLFNPMVIISASLATLCIAFYNVIKDEKIDKEKKNIMREACEGFFWSTLWYVFAIIFGILNNFSENITIKNVPHDYIQGTIVIGFFICTIVATFYLSIQLYNIITNVGAFYEPLEEDKPSVKRELIKLKNIFLRK